jgi:hypothetical protein
VGNFSEGAGLREGAKHGALFAVQVQSLLSITSVAVQGLLGAGHLSPYTDLVESSGAVTVMSPYTVLS